MARVDEVLNYKSKYGEKVLTNNLDINDEDSLNEVERKITTYKLAKLCLDPGTQTFDVNHYLGIHKYLFEDIYPFAGEIRSENISKRITFCPPMYIYNELNETLKKSNKNISRIKSKEDLLQFLVVLYSDLDVIHPFREGNGRCEREYIRQLIDHICMVNNLEPYYLDYSLLDRDTFVNAVVKADATLDYNDLLTLFSSILKVQKIDEENELKR